LQRAVGLRRELAERMFVVQVEVGLDCPFAIVVCGRRGRQTQKDGLLVDRFTA